MNMRETIKLNKKTYTITANIENITGWNCGFKQVSNMYISENNSSKGLSQKDIDKVVASKEFEDAILRNSSATAFLFADNMLRTGSTSAVIGSIMKSKRGAWMASPVYDNGKAHPFPDSLQIILIWWPEARLQFLIHDRPFFHIPRKGRKERLEAQVKRWSERQKGSNTKVGKFMWEEPRTLHRALKQIMLKTGQVKAKIPVKDTPDPDFTKPVKVAKNEW